MQHDLNEPIRGALIELVRRTWGPETAVTGVVSLSRRSSAVSRVSLSGGAGTPASIIVKHVPEIHFGPGLPGRENPEFAEELAAHRLLTRLGAEAGLKAALLAFDPCGITILEDLGPQGHPRQRGYDELVPMLATAYARLHGPTRGRQEEHAELRRACGLSDGIDLRRYGSMALARRARMGRLHLLSRTPAEMAGEVERELDEAIALAEQPGDFLCLIHDDLGNARQTFEVGNDLYLLDFEYTRYSHALLDLCKPLIGKFEMDLHTDNYLWINPYFPIGLATTYRSLMERDHGFAVPDAAWTRAMGGCLVYAMLTMIGRLMELEPDRRLVGTIAQNVNGVLYHLHGLLESLDSTPSVRALIPRYLGLPVQSGRLVLPTMAS